MSLRLTVIVALCATFLSIGAIQCGPDWARQPPSGPPPRTPAISDEQRDATDRLLVDALLDAADVPPDMTPRSNGIERWVPEGEAFLDAGGWLAINGTWLHGAEADSISDTRIAFADAAGAASYLDDVAGWTRHPDDVTIVGLPAGVIGHARDHQTIEGAEQRLVTLVVQVDRVLVGLGLALPGHGGDEQGRWLAWLDSAVTRTQEALRSTP